jgi:hypothetical protein
VSKRARETIEAAVSTLHAFRAVGPRARDEKVAERARVAWRLADEYTSLSVEHLTRRLIVTLTRAVSGPEPVVDELKRDLLEIILGEEWYRREQGYPTIIDPRSDNEPYIYRSGLLKKYCSSALFVQVRREAARRKWQEIMYAMAAGLAMTWATFLSFWAQSRFVKYSFPLFMVMVVSYMFKDRIKETSRGMSVKFLERKLYDRRILIADPAGGELGVCREKMEYVSPSSLPADAREIRRRDVDPTARIAEEELSETIFRYKKEIVLNARKLAGRTGGGGLTDIIRFQIARLLRDMDEPDQEIEYIDLQTRAHEPIRAVKTYHVDVVFRFHTRPDAPPQTTLTRLILDRNGIKRIERIEPGKASSAHRLRRCALVESSKSKVESSHCSAQPLTFDFRPARLDAVEACHRARRTQAAARGAGARRARPTGARRRSCRAPRARRRAGVPGQHRRATAPRRWRRRARAPRRQRERRPNRPRATAPTAPRARACPV